jgi:hypothetical protein
MSVTQHQLLLTLLVVAWCASCSPDTPTELTDDADAMAEVSAEADAVELSFIFELEGVGFSGHLPNELNYISDIEVDNGAHGAAKVVRVGDSFTLHITKELVSLEELKSDLAESGLFDVVFFDEGDESFFYELVLPDGRSAGHHFVRIITDERGSTYVMRTSEERQHGYFVTQLASRTLNSMKINF